MAKRKSNRAARRLLSVSIWAYDGAYRISNRKREFLNEDGERWVITQPSSKQKRASKSAYDFSGIVYGDCRNYS